MSLSLEGYPGLYHLRKYNQSLAYKAESLNHAMPSLALWGVVIAIECVIGILAMIAFIFLLLVALVCLVLAFIAVTIATVLKAVGFPRMYNILWTNRLQPALSEKQFP